MEVAGMAQGSDTKVTATFLDEDDLAFITNGAERIQHYLASCPDGGAQLAMTIRQRLGEGVDGNTWGPLFSSISILVGDAGANLIAWAAMAEPDKLEEMRSHAQSETANLVCRVAALYGPELKRAWEGWGESPHNWRNINRDVYQDLFTNRAFIRIRIEKYNGEEVIVEGPGESILSLAKGILVALRVVGSRAEFGESQIEAYLEESDRLVEILRPNNGRASGVEADNGPTGGAPPPP
jgi:hypothetical protein